MATYKAFLFNIVTDKGSAILVKQCKDTGELNLFVRFKGSKVLVSFKDMGTLQNFILLNSDKCLNNEQNLDKLAHILYTSEVKHYE